MTQTEALKMALEALKTFHYAMIDAGVLDRQEVLNQGFTAATAIEEALAQPEPKYTTTRNAWTGTATHKCNQCGREDFRSEHAAKFHKCEAVEEPEPHSQDRWLDIQLPDTTPPQRKPLTDEEIMNIAKVSCIGISPHEDTLNFAKVIEAVHGIKE